MSTSKKKHNAQVTLDELCALFKLDTIEKFDDRLCSFGTYGEAYKYAIAEGRSEEEAEEAAMKAESDERDEAVTKYRDAIIAAATKLFAEHHLVLTEKKRRGRMTDTFLVAPDKSWRDSAACLVETINGYGMFHFANVRDFCVSGPYTPKEAVLGHLHWIESYPAVYGSTSARSMVDRAMRY